MAFKGIRKPKRESGPGTRIAGRVVSLEQRCSALERDVSMLTIDEQVRQLSRRLTALEEKQTAAK